MATKDSPEKKMAPPDTFDSTVSMNSMKRFSNEQFQGWVEWFSDHYQGFHVVSFSLTGIRTDEYGDRYVGWELEVVRKSDASRHWFRHEESADVYEGTARNYPHNDTQILAHLEFILDAGPGGDMVEEDMSEDFGAELRR